MDTKVCKDCGEVKPVDQFTLCRSLKTGYSWFDSYCKTCKNIRNKEWQKRNRKARPPKEIITEKPCKTCGITKPLDQFRKLSNRSGKPHMSSYCNPCEYIRVKEWKKKKREARPPKEIKTEKTCNICGITKPIDQFRVIQVQGYQYHKSHCKPCGVLYLREHRAKHPGRAAEYMRKYRAANPEKYREYDRQRSHLRKERANEAS